MFSSGNHLIDPYLLFEKTGLQKGMHVADLGCGRVGHVVFPGARVIGEVGVMYAVDVLKDVLENIKRRAAAENALNVQTVWTDLEKAGKTGIPAKSLDAAFIINVLVQSNNPRQILDEAHRLLKDKARLVVVDWAKKFSFSPPAKRFVDFAEIRRWAAGKGLWLQEEFAAGPYHKGVIFFKQT